MGICQNRTLANLLARTTITALYFSQTELYQKEFITGETITTMPEADLCPGVKRYGYGH